KPTVTRVFTSYRFWSFPDDFRPLTDKIRTRTRGWRRDAVLNCHNVEAHQAWNDQSGPYRGATPPLSAHPHHGARRRDDAFDHRRRARQDPSQGTQGDEMGTAVPLLPRRGPRHSATGRRRARRRPRGRRKWLTAPSTTTAGIRRCRR